MFHTVFTTSLAGAGTEPYNRHATADQHPGGWCATTGAKCTLHLWQRCANVLGMARRVACPDRVFAHECLLGSQPHPATAKLQQQGFAFAFRGAVVSVGTL